MRKHSRFGRRDFLKHGGLALASVALAGCGANTPPASTATQASDAALASASDTAVAAASDAATVGASPAASVAPTPPPARIAGKLTIWAPGDDGTVVDWASDPILQQVQQATGTQIQIYKLGWATYPDQINAAIASGEMPDIVACVDHNNHLLISQWVRDGVVTPLDGTLANLLPNVLAEYKANPMLQEVKIDAKIYYKPVSWEQQPWYGSVIHVRKDLLDKYGMQPPDTFEQYFEFLRKAKADGSSGVLVGANAGLGGALDAFVGAYGVPGAGWVKADGGWQYWAIQPGAKQGLLLFRKMVAEGLVDPASFELTEAMRDKYVAGQGCSMIWNGGGHTGRIQNDMDLAGKGAKEWTAPALDAGAGSRGYAGGPPFYGATFIGSMQGNNPEGAAKVLDYLSSEEGIKLTVLGIEGRDYTGSGDNIKLNAEQRAKDGFPTEAGDTGSHPLATPITTWIPQQWQDWQVLYGKDQAFKDWYTKMLDNQKQYVLPTYGTLTTSPAWTDFQSTGNELINRAQLEIVKSTDEAAATALFDQLVQDWKGAGGDQATAEMSEALNTIYP